MRGYTFLIVCICLVISMCIFVRFKHKVYIHQNSIPDYVSSNAVWAGINLQQWFNIFIKDIAILENDYGMRVAHQFALYTILRIMRPTCVIESGVYKGVATHIIRKTLPETLIISLDPVCKSNQSFEKHEIYCGNKFKDFNDMGYKWRSVDKQNAIVIFDDHQSGFVRILQAKKFGFKFAIIEDNYPLHGGDNYSPKQVFTDVLSDITFMDDNGYTKTIISKKQHDINRKILADAIKVYAEFPPLNKDMTVQYLSKYFFKSISASNLDRMTSDGLEINVPFEREYLLYHFIAYVEIR